MSQIAITETVYAPIAKVFGTFTDLRKFGTRYKGITELTLLTDGPVKLGTRFRETRIMFKKASTIEMDVTAFTPHSHYRVESHAHGMHYISDYRFSSVGGNTHITLIFEVRPKSLLNKVLSPLMSLLLKATTKPMRQDLLDLRSFVEQPDCELSH